MGLDTSHGAFNGPYSSFGNLRKWLAEKIGINLNDYAGYMGGGTKDLTTIDHELMPLFNHSDCDGELSPQQCEQIAIGLDKVISTSDKDDFLHSNYQKAIRFRDGCLLAASKNQSIEFH